MKKSSWALILVIAVIAGWWLAKSSHNENTTSADQSSSESSAKKSAPTSLSPSNSVVSVESDSTSKKTPQRSAAANDVFFRRNIDKAIRNKKASAGIMSTPPSGSLSVTTLPLESSWKLWRGARAIPAKDFEEQGQTVFGKMAGFVVVDESNTVQADTVMAEGHSLVVFNERTQKPGIVTGSISVKIQSPAEADALMKQYNLRLVSALPDLGVYFLTSQSQPFDVQDLYQRLSHDSRFGQVEMEVVKHAYQKL